MHIEKKKKPAPSSRRGCFVGVRSFTTWSHFEVSRQHVKEDERAGLKHFNNDRSFGKLLKSSFRVMTGDGSESCSITDGSLRSTVLPEDL